MGLMAKIVTVNIGMQNLPTIHPVLTPVITNVLPVNRTRLSFSTACFFLVYKADTWTLVMFFQLLLLRYN
jgi:hypothetical protein